MVRRKKMNGIKETAIMKKIISSGIYAFTLLFAAIATLSCSSDDGIAEELQAEDLSQQTFTLTINATKGEDGATRALSIDDSGTKNVLNATWASGEKVSVYNYTKNKALEGYLVAQGSGATTTLSGQLTGQISIYDQLGFTFCSAEYGSQDGTLDYIAKNCDNAVGYANVTSISDGIITVNNNSNVQFTNNQSIICFTLIDKADATTKLNASTIHLTMTAIGHDYSTDTDMSEEVANYTFNISGDAVTKNSGNGVLYFAIPQSKYYYNSNYSHTLDITATVGSDTYRYVKAGCPSFTNGKYYEISINMRKAWDGDLSKLTAGTPEWYAVATDGMTIYGTLNENVKVSVADGAAVTLSGATIDDSNNYCLLPGITCEGDATITLSGVNTVKRFYSNSYPSIFVPENKTLTIQGDGSLVATCIGNGSDDDDLYRKSGNIVINGGTITANSDYNTVGIGAHSGECGDITINGGNITVIGDYACIGIGAGSSGKCGNITVTGGTITSSGTSTESFSCSLGGITDGSCGDIIISGGTVNVEGSTAIGGNCGDISVSGGTVNALGTDVGIGCCSNTKSCGDISFTGGTIIASASYYGPVIGGNCGNITITDDVTKVSATLRGGYQGVTIGTRDNMTCGVITIAGKVRGNITFTPYIYEHAMVDLSTVTEDVKINDANTLTGTLSANVKVSIVDGATITLNNVYFTNDPVDNSNYLWAGITCEGDATIKLSGDNVVKSFYITLPGIEVPANKTLTIQGQGSLTAAGAPGIGGNGNINITGGTINASGIYDNSPAIGGTGSITITGGTITATGHSWGPGIGGMPYRTCGDITITNGVTSVTASTEKGTYSIGPGPSGTAGTITIGGVVTGGITDKSYTYRP